MKKIIGKKKYLLLLALAVAALIWFLIEPSNDRDWSADQKILAEIHFEGNLVHIRNIRNISHLTPAEYTVAYYDRTFDLDKLVRAWYMVELFDDVWRGPAHTLLSFEFEGPEYVAISVEIRKEKGEEFSPLLGLFKQYELMYVIADERDVIKLRTNYRNDEVYLYPVVATRQQVRQLFVDMLKRAQKLQTEPEFYNTLSNTCTTNIVDHVRKIAPGSIPLSYKVLLPGYSDELAYELGLIDTTRPFEETRRRRLISERARRSGDNPNFSEIIRQFDEGR